MTLDSYSQDLKPNENFREFYDAVGRLYPEEEVVFKTLRGLIRRRFILSYLQKFRGLLLDLGCNRGYYISEYNNDSAIGIDISYPVLQEAKNRLPEVNFLQGDAQQLSFLKPNSVDAILCSEMIEHVQNARRVFSECFRILKPSGVILITTPNYKKEKPTWIKIDEMKSYGVQGVKDDLYFHTAFRPEELKEMAESAGFANIETGTFEKEVKYATRIPVIFYHLVKLLNKIFVRSDKLTGANETMLNKSSLFIYRFCKFLRLNRFFISLVREGVRSYLFAQKNTFARSADNP
ncbi:MAG: class I SAM-dependent methyltransferase [Caldithrix sp.]|nr:MAG: class I SAM-dependent methyltransferase [Caldithrix sp.]